MSNWSWLRLRIEERCFNWRNVSIPVSVISDWSLSLHLLLEGFTLSAAGLSNLPVELVALFIAQVSLDCALMDFVESLVLLAGSDALLVDAKRSKDNGDE